MVGHNFSTTKCQTEYLDVFGIKQPSKTTSVLKVHCLKGRWSNVSQFLPFDRLSTLELHATAALIIESWGLWKGLTVQRLQIVKELPDHSTTCICAPDALVTVLFNWNGWLRWLGCDLGLLDMKVDWLGFGPSLFLLLLRGFALCF